MKLVVVLFVGLLCGSSGSSQEGHSFTNSGNDLLKTCEAGEHDRASSTLYGAYILGVSEGFFVANRQSFAAMSSLDAQCSRKTLQALAPVFQKFDTGNGVTNGQIIEVVVKYLKNHPETRHNSADDLIVEALAESFPHHPK